jgi:3-phenylpropionate/cinnamic acid dioxygenase small subunit
MPRPVQTLDLSELLGTRSFPMEDRLAILQLISLYSHLVDDFDVTQWGDLFTEDARFEIAFAADRPENAAVWQGRKAILEVIAPRQSNFRAQGIQRRHYLTNPVVHHQGADSARVMVYLMLASVPPGGGMEIEGTGRYDGLVVKTSDGWRIRDWVLTADGHAGPLEMPVGPE